MTFEKQLPNARWKHKSKVNIKRSKLLYKLKWTVLIARFGDLLILTVSRGVATNVFFLVLAVSVDKQLFMNMNLNSRTLNSMK